MTWEIAFVLLLMLGALVSFVWEKIPTDLTSLGVFAILLGASLLPFTQSLPSLDSLLTVFANPAPITIGALFIVSAALEKCGAIDVLAHHLGKITRFGYAGVLLFMVLLVAFISAFINNTPVVVIFMPVILTLSRKLGVASSKLLIPLSYASIFGGTCTLVGTSTNILASSILESSGYPPIRMFELTAVGVPLLLIGATYLLVFGRKLLPVRSSLTAILSEEERKEYFTEAFVPPGSDLVGKSAEESGLLKGKGVRLMEIIRHEVALHGTLKNIVLEAGDRLILACRPSGFVHASKVSGLKLGAEEREGLETISAHEGAIVEGVIGPRSTLIGRKMSEMNFRQRFRMIVLAVHRRGINMRESIGELAFEPGDIILMMGTDRARDELRKSDDIFLLDRPPTALADYGKKAPIVVGSVAVMIALVSFNIVPIAAASVIAVAFLMLTGCVKPKEGYASIEWGILILIYGMLGLGQAMETSGASRLIADGLVGLTHLGIRPEWQPFVVLACLYLIASTMTEVLSNNATVVLMTPIGIGLGMSMGIDPRPFVIALCIASSASFATPIGYQTNTYVYGVGGYKFSDFLKIGIPLNLCYFVGTMLIVPIFWKF